MRSRMSVVSTVGACAVLLLAAAAPALAQTGRISGVVSEASTGQPVQGAAILLVGTELSTLTSADGRYLLLNVPAGSHTLAVELIGRAPTEQQVTVQADELTTLNIELETQAIALQEVVVTGVSGATVKAKVPFDVGTLSMADIPVPSISAGSAIQGKVPGAMVVQGSGRPGSAPAILLRGPKSIDASGRSQEPLYVVDGVILGSGGRSTMMAGGGSMAGGSGSTSGMVDIGSLDIQEIEIVKGAAAASLYGSRAANGVVQITTRRGAEMPDGQIRYTVRSEYGQSDLPGSFPTLQHHAWALNEDGTQFLTPEGDECDFLACPNVVDAGQKAAPGEAADAWNSYATQPWPGGAYDQVKRFFTNGAFMRNYISASGRTGATNFHLSFGHESDEGVMPGQEGFERLSFRANLDQAIQEDLQISTSAYYSRADGTIGQGQLFDLTRMQAGVDLTACEGDATRSCLDDPENLILNANPTNLESPNPLYEMLVEDNAEDRGRFLGSANFRYAPLSWLDLDANISYDRLDHEETQFTPKGFRTLDTDVTVNEGALELFDELQEAINASLTATMRFDLTENVSNRTQFRYLYERQDEVWNATDGYDFAVSGVPGLDNLNIENLEAESFTSSIRADGYFAITNFDIADRYVVDALVRNDGSSLFGPDERRQWYYRLAGAWRLGEEPWFDVPFVDELKLRYSYGTAGSRPSFEAQYETFDLEDGLVVPVTLGNEDLRPERSREQEAGFDASLFGGRIVLGLTYANTVTQDQILQVPLPAYTGYESQWRNAGTLEGNTWEASLDARLVETEDFFWSARVLFDRTRSEITELNVPAFTYGVGVGQGLGSIYYARAGEEHGTFYGVHYARGCGDLPQEMSCDGFTVNDEGYLVWVGGGSLADNAWGTSSADDGVTVRGAPVMWGTPFAGQCTDRSSGERTLFCPVGNSLPDYRFSFSSTLTWRGFSLYGLVDAVQGFDVYNQPMQWALFRRNIGMMDQTGVPDEQQKPIGYYDALYGVSGLQPSNVFVEDGSFVKLRELAFSYRFDPDNLANLPGLNAFSGITLNLIGRNLLTRTDYRGYDPEVGEGGGETGSAALARVDGFQYPNFRTWTLGIELNF